MVRVATAMAAVCVLLCGRAARAADDDLKLPEWSVAPASREEWLKQERSREAAARRKAKAAPGAAGIQKLPALELPQAGLVLPASALPPLPGAPKQTAAPKQTGAPAARNAPAAVVPAASRAPVSAPERPALAGRSPAGAAAPAAADSAIAASPRPDDRGDKHGFLVGLRLGLLVPSGRPDGAYAAAGADVPFARRAATIPVSLQLGYRLPWLSRDLAVVAEGGYYPLSSSGSRSFPQDPDFTTLAYSYKATQIPLFAGLEYRLPFLLPGVFSRLSLSAGGGFAAVWSKITSTYSAEGVTDAPQKGWALGFSADAGAAFLLGPGQLTFDLRYVNARTDLRLQSLYPGQPWNARKGDVQGTNYLFGYRIAL